MPDGGFKEFGGKWKSVSASGLAATGGIGHVRGAKARGAVLEAARRDVGCHAAWARWSATADELGDLVDEIKRRPVRTVADLAVTFDALSFLLLSDGAVDDHQAKRQVRLFGDDLRRLAAELGPPPGGQVGVSEQSRT